MLSAVIETALNQVLQFNRQAPQALAQLQQKIVAFTLTWPPQRLLLQFTPHAVHVTLNNAVPADLELTGSVWAFMQVQRTRDLKQVSGLQISGDFVLAKSLNELLAPAQIDWEAALAKLIGDIPAFALSQFAQQRVTAIQRKQQALQQSVKTYLQSEVQWVPTADELEIFYHDVDELRAAVDRIEAKWQTLAAQLQLGDQ